MENQRETQKIRRQITGRGLGHEVNVYVPLGLVKPKVAPRRDQEFSPSAEQGMQQYELTDKEVERWYEHDEFLQQVIEGQDKNLAIIGEPGAGKSTWLEQIALYVDKLENSFPICIPLGNLGEKTLEDYLLQNWLKDAERFLPLERGVSSEAIELEELFKLCKVCLLLDGADEMRLQRAESPLQRIAYHLTGWVASARVVLTCRLNVWEAHPNSLPNFETYRTLIFDDKQVRDFIELWFAQAGESTLGEQLKNKLGESGRERIRDLIKNPLRLALLCKTWATKQGELPKTKAVLYQRFRDDFYKWKESEFPTEWKQRQALNAALGQLALAAIRYKLPLRETVAYEQMGESCFDLARSLGWLNLVYRDSETDEPVYAFFHLTFQEYFAAIKLADVINGSVRDELRQDLDNQINEITESRWREVVLLTVEILNNSDIFLQYIKQKCDEIVSSSSQIQALLNQVSDLSISGVTFPADQAAIRAFYFALLLNFDFDLALSFNFDLKNVFGINTLIEDVEVKLGDNLESALQLLCENPMFVGIFSHLVNEFVRDNPIITGIFAREICSNPIHVIKLLIKLNNVLNSSEQDAFTRKITQSCRIIRNIVITNFTNSERSKPVFEMAQELARNLAFDSNFIAGVEFIILNLDKLAPALDPNRNSEKIDYEELQEELKKHMVDKFSKSQWNEENFDAFWKVSGKNWTQELQDILGLDSSDSRLDFSFDKHEINLLKQYYNTNKLLIECLNVAHNAQNVTEEVRSDILISFLINPPN